ncbi:U5 small nuclear ribonucleoprotein TSSC4-like [Daphnia carinata]|uniref:U5 small nuclear ribonucleoprotein TSSC4-like n=1 Tax=Daphnia carinata TaxID=120202 RepID=UPI002579534D|nr:U5 small nuclear ribonucleoprotein TSSC4-like [Daphnia carinata]
MEPGRIGKLESGRKDSFSLQCQTEAFSARRESIFGNLPVVELAQKEVYALPSSAACNSLTEEEASINDDVTSYKGEESMFKRPMPKLKKSSHAPRRYQYLNKTNTPDHKRNPHKWVKYSLATTSDVTDKSNTAAALSFLKDLEKRKHSLEDEIPEPVDTGKIVFKKPRTCERTCDRRAEKSKTYRDGKLCMPAFEFGFKRAKETKKEKKVKGENSSQKAKVQSCLSHLEEEGDDNDNDDNNSDEKKV